MKELLYLAAAKIPVGSGGNGSIDIPKVDADTAVESILYTVYIWAGIVAVLVIVIAGYIFVLSKGDQQQVTKARNAIIGAAVGLIVVLFAFAITRFILGNVD
ncbi:hypothetical protein EOL96_07990 [Candidatus Saccharibacteria bacterium]|nr:hypothetical protein [Candidatus Saccharibacteria bacterium]